MPKTPIDPIHPDGGVVDVWLMDDQTIACDPILVNAVIDAVDTTCQDPKRGGVRNPTKTHVILYASPQDLQLNHSAWGINQIQQKATLNTPSDPLKTLGATLGGPQHRCDDFNKRFKVMQAMHHKLTTLNDPAVELKLAKHCLGESKAQHLLRILRTRTSPHAPHS